MSKLDDCEHFANWCANEGFKPGQGAALIRLAKRAHSAGEREANTGKSGNAARERFEKLADEVANLRTEWNGLWPTCYRTDEHKFEVRIPDIA